MPTGSAALPVIALMTLLVTLNSAFANTASEFQTEEEEFLHHCEDSAESERLCPNIGTENDRVFSEPILSWSTQVDVRPQSCQSFFDDYLHTRRGIRIESALKDASPFSSYKSTVRTFPVVDFYSDGSVRVVKTRDLSSSSFTSDSSESRLFKQLITDAEEIQKSLIERLKLRKEISATVFGETTTIREGEVKDVTIDLVIQSGIATASHALQLDLAAKEIKRRWGFSLQVIEIP